MAVAFHQEPFLEKSGDIVEKIIISGIPEFKGIIFTGTLGQAP
jgi:hypothetical protein